MYLGVPPHNRSCSSFQAQQSGASAAIAAPLVIGFSYPMIGFTGVFLFTGVVLMIGVIAVFAQGQSATGRTLEEITETPNTPHHRVNL